MARATYRNWHAIFSYISTNRLLKESECDYIHLQNDFICLSPEQDSRFHKAVEDVIGNLGSKRLMV